MTINQSSLQEELRILNVYTLNNRTSKINKFKNLIELKIKDENS